METNSTKTKSESVDERSTEIVSVSSPVIKVYGSIGVEATLESNWESNSEATEAEARSDPNGVKSEVKGIMEKDAPVEE